MGKAIKLMIIGLIGIIAFWLNDMINSIVMSFFGGAGSLDPLIAFVVGLLIFLAELWTIGWMIMKIPRVAHYFGAWLDLTWFRVQLMQQASYGWH